VRFGFFVVERTLAGVAFSDFSAVGFGRRPRLEWPPIWVYLSGVRKGGDDMTGGVGAVSASVPVWLVIPVLLLLVLGGVKLIKLLLLALKR